MKRAVTAVAVFFLCCFGAIAQSVDSYFMRDAVGVKSYPAPPRLAQRAAMVPATVLPSAESTVPEKIMAIHDWNARGREPMRVGFRRELPDVIEARISSVAAKSAIQSFGRGVIAATERGTIAWSTMIRVEKAYSVRLHLENVSLPEGATLWTYSEGQTPVGFGRELIDNHGGLWTPSVFGENVYLDIEVPASNAAASFTIREVVEMFNIKPQAIQPQDSPTCLVDANCVTTSTFSKINESKRGIASLLFVTSDGAAVCTGGLLNDTSNSGTPYLLTANHCFHDQSVASNVEAAFDFATDSCAGGNFNRAAAPKVNGATWLASSDSSDYTLIRLNAVPSGRVFLGWNANDAAVSSAVTLHRVSHPVPVDSIYPQMYSSTVVDTTRNTCSGVPRPNFIYSTSVGGQGGVYGGSSGSPVMLSNGQVVGQLLGSCGPDPSAGCDVHNATVDGAFSASFSGISQFIAGSPVQPPGCTANSTTMCLSDNRFAVSATWRTPDGNSGNGTAVRLTADTGYFTFFSATNVEAVVKVLNACSFSQKIWVFAGGLTNVNVVLTVRDTKTGTVKTYTNPQSTAFQPIQDTSAFATCP